MRREWTGAAFVVAGVGLANAQDEDVPERAERRVFSAFPESTSFRSIVRDVDSKSRAVVERMLPFKVHFNELGPHTLYVAFRDGKPLGLLYLRTEDGGWGLAEIGWSMTLDLRIAGFQFRRSRSRFRHAIERSPFAARIVGRDFDQLTELLDENGELQLRPSDVPTGAEELAAVVVRSAMKTLAVTGSVWQGELLRLRDLALGLDAFPAAASVRRQVVDLESKEVGELEYIRSLRIIRARAKGRRELGVVVESEVVYADEPVTLRWILTPKLAVRRVQPVGPRGDKRLASACEELEGTPLLEYRSDGTRLGATTAELGRILRHMRNSGRR